MGVEAINFLLMMVSACWHWRWSNATGVRWWWPSCVCPSLPAALRPVVYPATGETIQVSMVQGNIPQSLKWDEGSFLIR